MRHPLDMWGICRDRAESSNSDTVKVLFRPLAKLESRSSFVSIALGDADDTK